MTTRPVSLTFLKLNTSFYFLYSIILNCVFDKCVRVY